MKACVIGYPLLKTLSPVIHGAWLARYNIAGSYDARAVAPENLVREIGVLRECGYDGFNVTVPHKIAVHDMCDHLDDAARAIGAVNTVCFKDGKRYGYNTDAYGFARSVEEEMHGLQWEKINALVLGAGGAARAICHALRDKKCASIHIANRTQVRAARLACDFDLEILDWDDARNVPSSINMVVNCTILGMTDAPPLSIDLSRMARGGIVCDLVYTPLITPLLQQARDHAHYSVTGIGMLLHQAARAFALWTGHMPDVDDALREKVMTL